MRRGREEEMRRGRDEERKRGGEQMEKGEDEERRTAGKERWNKGTSRSLFVRWKNSPLSAVLSKTG